MTLPATAVRFGEVVEASIERLLGQCHELYDAPVLGTLVRAGESVYAVVEGEGRTMVGEHTIEWGKRDIFVVPAWAPHHHEAATDAFAFSFSDRGLHQKLGLFRERRGNRTD